MNLIIKDLKVPAKLDNSEQYLKACSLELEISITTILLIKILSKEQDFRNKEKFNSILTLAVKVTYGYVKKAEPKPCLFLSF